MSIDKFCNTEDEREIYKLAAEQFSYEITYNTAETEIKRTSLQDRYSGFIVEVYRRQRDFVKAEFVDRLKESVNNYRKNYKR